MKKPRCTECGSRRFRKDAIGRVVCEEGHVMAGYVQETMEREWDGGKSKTRKLRKNKARKVKAASRYYRGPKASFLFVELAQVMLRQQIWVLVNKYHFPAELESVARELWALYLSYLDVPNAPELSDDPPGDATMDEAAAQNAPGTSLESDDSSVRLEAAFPSDSSDADVALEYDEHMDPLVSMKKRRERLWAVSGASSSLKRLRPHFTLVVCYLSCLTLRVPIFVSDLINLVEQQELPFLHFAKNLPREFREVITQDVAEALNMQALPTLIDRYHMEVDMSMQINRFVRLYADSDVTFPAVNFLPLLWRAVKGLALHPVFYTATKAILRRLNVDFSYRADPPPGDRVRNFAKTKRTTKNNDLYTLLTPDCVLVAAVVFSAKLIYTLDGTDRSCKEPSEAVFGLPSRATWLAALEQLDAVSRPHDVSYLRRKAVQDYTPSELDGFLDFAQEHLCPENDLPKYSRYLDQQYPLPEVEPPNDSAVEAEVDRIITELYTDESKPRLTTDEGDTPLLFGDQYPFYPKAPARDPDPHPPELTRVYELAGRIVGVKGDVVQAVVYELEARMKGARFRAEWKEDELQFSSDEDGSEESGSEDGTEGM